MFFHLVELDLPLRVRQVGLRQWVHQQPGDAAQDEGEVLLAVDAGEVVEEQVVREGESRSSSSSSSSVGVRVGVGGGGGGAEEEVAGQRAGGGWGGRAVLVQGDDQDLKEVQIIKCL